MVELKGHQQAAVSLMPDVDGIGSGSLLDPVMPGSNSFFSHHS